MTAERMDDFVAATRSIATEAEFVRRFPHPFLVREATTRRGRAAAAAEPERRTLRVSKAAAPVGDGFAQGGDVWLFRLCPRDPERNEGAVTLGADAACDVVIDDATVSALHAKFTLEVQAPDDDEDDGRRFYVADAGSSNGTFVDGEATAAGVPARIEDQASVRFGPQVKVQFFTAAGFFQFLDFYRRIKKRGT